MNAAIILITAAAVAALSLSLLVLVPLLDLDDLAVDSTVRASTAAVLGLLPAGYVAAHLGFSRVAPPMVPGEAFGLRASAEVLVATAWVSLVNLLLVLGGDLVAASGAAEATTTFQASCVLTVFVVFTAGLLLLLLSVSRPIPETVTRQSIQAIKVAGMMLVMVNTSVSVALVWFT